MTEELHLTLAPRKKNIEATLDLPGSKSIANRVLLLAAVAKGTSILHNVPDVAEDVRLMIHALQQLGVAIVPLNKPHSYRILGCDGVFPIKTAQLFCGNSGTTMRMLTALLSLMSGEYTLIGTERMKHRPIGDLVDSLRQLGADITYLERVGYPPLSIGPFRDRATAEISCSGKDSSQYLTGLLMALSAMSRNGVIRVKDGLRSKSYVDMTLSLLSKFGCAVICEDLHYTLKSARPLQAIEYTIEPDASSASYFLACAALNGCVTINNMGKNSLQGDKNFAAILEKMGAEVVYHHNAITVRAHTALKAININMENMPDAAMTLAVLCLFAEGTSHISGIGTWKIKETDRLHAIQTELIKLGAKILTSDDTITITPPQKLNEGVAIDTYDDHRMAMSFSLVAAAGVEVVINHYRCVGKTFANYFNLFQQLCY